ncbi:MAG: hypothetical protein J2P45_00870 [Candidatus Dormibacteraeota bacterium]|nr:hypothetical protein [Candidatus Dormibacteraeota bacterium]
MTAVPGDGSVATCDRACLNEFVDRYLDALIAHDPSRLPATENVRFTENGQQLELGDGLWNTMAGKGSYRLFVTDVPAGQVAFIGTIREMGQTPDSPNPALMALRLKVEDRRLAEIEMIVVRDAEAAKRVENLGRPNVRFTTPVPPAQQESRQSLIRVANAYFAGMQLNDGKGDYPFTEDCNRIENGTQTTNAQVDPSPGATRSTSYSIAWSCLEQFQSGLLHFVTRIRDRRFVAVDQDYGLVFSFVFFDHAAGQTRTFQTPSGATVTAGPTEPWTWEIAEMFKIQDGKIHQIEAVLQRVPYGMNAGWGSTQQGMSTEPQDVTGVAEGPGATVA